MRKTFYTLKPSGFKNKIRIALIADLHSASPKRIVAELKRLKPDYILLAGDILESLNGSKDDINERGFDIFKECANIAPSFYCTGNHEDNAVRSHARKSFPEKRSYAPHNVERIKATGVEFLLDSYVFKDGIAFGGLASGLVNENHEPNQDFLNEFAKIDAPKILICHHPEYYERYIKELPIDVIVSGHAHGGQWRFFGRGIYAPGQGLLPKYTSGVYDGRLVVSKGLKPSWPIPRIFNPREIVIIDI